MNRSRHSIQAHRGRRLGAVVPSREFLSVIALLILVGSGACRQDMHDQPKYEPLESSDFFGDGQASRPLPEGTIARGHLRQDSHFYTGRVGGQFAEQFPFEITRQVLERGRERYDIYCSPCHGLTGNGRGMIVERGYKQSVPFHDQRLKDSPPGYYFDVMTKGFGVMYPYASRVKPRDRWAIAAYIRALQYSQSASWDDLSGEDRRRLEELQ